jgi:hypothetical protein
MVSCEGAGIQNGFVLPAFQTLLEGVLVHFGFAAAGLQGLAGRLGEMNIFQQSQRFLV